MDIERKIDLVKKNPTEEIITEGNLREVFENHSAPKHYIGFEISGKVHLGTGLCTVLKINDFLEAGIKPAILLADYHSWINGKMDGDLDNIQAVAEGYFKHAFISLGLDESKVEYVLASKLYDRDYWPEVLRISKDTTIKRMLRCITIMGRSETEGTKSSAILYPAMQAADIFKLDVQIAHAGMDQRKVHMLAWEIARKRERGFVSVHGKLLPSLQGIQRMNPTDDQIIDAKMSKSKPMGAIFIHDSEDDIRKKISKAYCPMGIVEGNPIIEYAEQLLLRDGPVKVERPRKFGGDLEISDSMELRKVFIEKSLHPADLKNAVASALSDLLKPSRDYFERNSKYLDQIKNMRITK